MRGCDTPDRPRHRILPADMGARCCRLIARKGPAGRSSHGPLLCCRFLRRLLLLLDLIHRGQAQCFPQFATEALFLFSDRRRCSTAIVDLLLAVAAAVVGTSVVIVIVLLCGRLARQGRRLLCPCWRRSTTSGGRGPVARGTRIHGVLGRHRLGSGVRQ